MLIIAIAWLYVVTLMAFAETSVIAGLTTFVFYGVGPLAILLWLLGTPERRRRQQRRAARSRDDARDDAATGPTASARSAPPSGRTGDRDGSSSSAEDR